MKATVLVAKYTTEELLAMDLAIHDDPTNRVIRIVGLPPC
jgi:hypothetical protein